MHRGAFTAAVGFVWACAAVGEVQIPRGFEIVQIVPTSTFIFDTQINECGQIAFIRWTGEDWSTSEIYVYDNGAITRITDNDRRDRKPRINNVGELIWEFGEYPEPDTAVHYQRLPDGPVVVLDTNNEFGFNDLDINDQGHAAWTKGRYWDCPSMAEVFFWDGANVVQIQPDHDFFDTAVSLNGEDQIAWGHKESCADPWKGEIHLYLNGDIINVPSPERHSQVPSLNNALQMTWSAADDVIFYEDGVQLREFGTAADVNNRGDFVFSRWDEPQRTWHAWLYEKRRNGWRSYQLTDDDQWSTYIYVNDLGETAWIRAPRPGARDMELLLLRRVRTGDLDFDERIDSVDYRQFAGCMTGPVRTDGLCMCRFADVDYDGDADLADFAVLQRNFAP